ncbi:PhzF family phenazine biosynthesis protein [Niveibacterium umoris]|uniref:Trans-2,3-dihydro-3-hydroxyanthranilate isomerase n=1 Tax=Niveibacterium umoris TaxID=1193620 RepID=A0A840BR43_9RHOO|nr:PhzF family phenazine biosynthesis protein [Niveibacterium umoris]MBB4014008.1 trans-2,3-dihydro-3-hydroxyanthranilate isomerase [Niveibacterium umoris]
MTSHPYWLADVFTRQAFAGNPLAVFPHGDLVDPAMMQAIASELNLSETVFVLPPDDPAHAARVRIFTPASELPFAGHPTIGTALLLASFAPHALPDGEHLLVLEEGVGPVPVRVTMQDGEALRAEFNTAQAPQFKPAPPDALIAQMLGLPDDAILPGSGVASCGVPFLCVPLRDRAQLARAVPNGSAMHQGLDGLASGVYLYCDDGQNPDLLHARMFARGLGIGEDPATGSAAAALGGLLASRDARDTAELRWQISQGEDMGRPSRIDLSASRQGGAIAAVRVGGQAVFIGEGRLITP